MSYLATLSLRSELPKYDKVLTIQTKIGKVPLYKFIEKFLFIEDAEGKKIPFILNEDQIDLYITMCQQRLRGEPIRINILKARQKGFSTFIAGIIFCMVIFTPGRRAGIVADIAEHASNLFEKYQFFYNNLPDEIKPPKKKSNAKEVVVEYSTGQTSSIRIMVQGDSAGRSGTYQYLHLSECAFWKDLDSTLVSLLQTVSATNLDSMIFIETTANGVNDYKRRWDHDYSGNSTYIPKFYPWFTTARYRTKLRSNLVIPNWLIDMEERYRLDKEQCAWYLNQFHEVGGDLEKLRQEYPSNPVEAFVTSGNSVFNAELVAKRKIEICENQDKVISGIFTYSHEHSKDGQRIDVKNIEFIASRNGKLKIYEQPIAGHPYVVTSDPANGGEDYFAVHVFDNYTCKQVAVYHKNKCDADEVAYQMYCLARHYNNALITGETNTTSYLLELCHKFGHRKIYQDQDVEDLTGRYINRFGYKVKTNNRSYMIDLFKIAFRDSPSIINDYDTICEMENFQVVKSASGKEKIEASGQAHDDLVMSACGFFLCRHAQNCVPTMTEETRTNELIFDPCHLMEKEDVVEDTFISWD